MKKTVTRVLSMALCLAVLSGCTAKTASTEAPAAAAGTEAASAEDKPETGKEEETASAAGETKTIIDQGGNEVVIPVNIERVAIASLWPLPSVYVLYQGSGAKLVGMHPASKSAAEYSLLMKVAPELKDVDTSFIQGGEVNVEELIKLKPDVIFCNANNAKEREVLLKTGIPVVGFSTSIAGFNTVETVNKWVELLGEVFNEPDKVAGITDYGREVAADIEKRLKDVKEEDKPKVMIIYHYKDGVFQTSGNQFFGQYWCDATGAVSVSKDIPGSGVDLTMEQIYEWDPDIIYVTNFSPYLPQDFYDNSIEGFDWSPVKAVREHKVYKFPLGMYRWFPPSSDSSLCLYWMAQKNHPEVFTDFDLNQTIKDFYLKFYNMELTDEEVEGMFNPPREAADGV
jgi:iron complex transport system substrate-binding protein